MNSTAKLKEKLENSLIRARLKKGAQISYWLGSVCSIAAILIHYNWGNDEFWNFFSLWAAVIGSMYVVSGSKDLKLIELFELLYDNKKS